MTAPLNTNIKGDIQLATNTAFNGDVGYTITRAVANSRINKWAKYKPLVLDQMTPLTTTNRENLNQGFSDFSFTTAASCFNAAKAANADWSYQGPTDDSNATPYRVTDFVPYNASSQTPFAGNGYNKNARNPFSLYMKPNRGGAGAGLSGYWVFQVVWNYTQEEISLSDLKAFKDYASSNWTWCILANVTGTVANYPIYSDKSCTTLYRVGNPSASRFVGYFKVDYDAQIIGTKEAYIGIYAGSHFIYLPVKSNASFEINNPVAEISMDWKSNTDSSAPSPNKEGVTIIVQADSMSSTGNRIASVETILVLSVPPSWTPGANTITIRTIQTIVDAVGNNLTEQDTLMLGASDFVDGKYYFKKTWFVGSQSHFAMADTCTIGVNYVSDGNTYTAIAQTSFDRIASDRINIQVAQ